MRNGHGNATAAVYQNGNSIFTVAGHIKAKQCLYAQADKKKSLASEDN